MRKHLFFSVDEWVRLPWWQQRMYVDLLNEQLAVEAGEEPERDPADAVTDSAGLADMGFNVANATPAPTNQ